MNISKQHTADASFSIHVDAPNNEQALLRVATQLERIAKHLRQGEQPVTDEEQSTQWFKNLETTEGHEATYHFSYTYTITAWKERYTQES